MSKWIYAISIALQLSGAVLLIIKYWFGSSKDQLASIQRKRTHIENETIVIGDTGPSDQEFIEELWICRIAFLYIATGYIVGIWGNIESTNRYCLALLIAFISCILVIAGKVISYSFGKPFHK